MLTLAEVPNTGLQPEREQQLSALFIDTSTYGTRASTVLRATATEVEIEELTHAPGHPNISKVRASFRFVI